jgi:hypothetical protein
MQDAPCVPVPANDGMAQYSDIAIIFSLAKNATFADLAGYLDTLSIDGWHPDVPTAISLKFAAVRTTDATRQPGI